VVKVHRHKEQGFTLIEVMITMVIAMVVLGGMSTLFISQTRTASMLNQKSEAMNDLFLASQIMQFELRGAKAICWNSANSAIIYQPISSLAVNNLTSSCNSAAASAITNGSFQSRAISANKPTPYICWDMPDDGSGCQELLRGMKANTGIIVTPTSNADLRAVRKVTLTAQYLDRDRNQKDLSLSFKVWPRNTQ